MPCALISIARRPVECGATRESCDESTNPGDVAGSVCMMHAIFSLVQCQIPVAFPHCVNRCCSVSSRPHFPHRGEFMSLILASRTFVGTKSCSTTYHTDFISSDVHTEFQLSHMTSHGVWGNNCSMLIVCGSCCYVAMTCTMWYMCRRR
jgi:hypothetical protein